MMLGGASSAGSLKARSACLHRTVPFSSGDLMASTGVPHRINLGCGERWLPGWRNVDGGPWTRLHWLQATPIPDRLLPSTVRRYPRDLVRWDLRHVPLPFATASASIVFSQWVLEYLTTEESAAILRECRRILRPDGLIRLNQTNIEAIVEAYFDGAVGPGTEAVARAARFLAAAAPGHTTRSARILRRGGVQQLFDQPKLEWMLSEAGFTEITFVRLHEGECPNLIELEHEWDPPLIRVEAKAAGRAS
jgi:hypothetical protein